MYVLDSSTIIEMIRKTELGNKAMQICNGENAVTTSICKHEILAGARNEKELFILTNLFNGFEILEHNSNSAVFSAEIYKDLKNKGKMIKDMDVLIAGICKENSATLITMDKEFERIDGFDVRLVR